MDKKRLFVIGARGFLGAYAVRSSAGTFEVIRGDRSSTSQPGAAEIDISDASSVDRAFREARPDCVLLLAAMSDIDRCEASPEQAFATNARGAENVANAGASDSISRYELGRRLAARAGVSAKLVRPQDAPAPGRAPRGEDHFLLTDKIRNFSGVEVQTSEQVIERCFS